MDSSAQISIQLSTPDPPTERSENESKYLSLSMKIRKQRLNNKEKRNKLSN